MSLLLLDANVFISAENDHFPRSYVPGFWDHLREAHGRGVLGSIHRVKEELTKGTPCREWADGCADSFFAPDDVATVAAFPATAKWAAGMGKPDASVAEFLRVADFRLVAAALAHGHTVVTREKAARDGHKLKVPDACADLGIECIHPVEAFRQSGLRLVTG